MHRSVAIGYIYVRFGIPEHIFYPAYMYACLRAMSYDALLIVPVSKKVPDTSWKNC